MAPRSSSPTPACERNSLSVFDLAALLSGIPGGVAPDRRFSLSAIAGDVTCVAATEAEVKGRKRLALNFAAAWFYFFYRTVTPVKILIRQHLSHIHMGVLVGFTVQSDNLIVQTPIIKYINHKIDKLQFVVYKCLLLIKTSLNKHHIKKTP